MNGMKPFAMKMDPGAAEVIAALHRAGYKAYAVGGCVRDSLMGKTPHDWDICSSALPEQVLAVFGEARCIPTGLKHGTITVKQSGGLYEVTTFRTEGTYTDGRHPDAVDFVTRVEEDLSRRDFTMNAMAYNDEEGLVDPFGGREDLLVRREIRAVGEPVQRFSEDALRIMRLFRFAAREQLGMDGATLDAARMLRGNLRRISAERIREEMLGLLAAKQPGRWMLPEIFGVILPEAAGDEAAFAHARRMIDAAPAVKEVRLAALLSSAGDEARAIMRRLRFDVRTIDAVCALVSLKDFAPETEAHALRAQTRRFLGRHGDECAQHLCLLRAAQREAGEALPALDAFLAMAQAVRAQGLCCSLKELAVSGDALIREADVRPGPALGAMLAQLLEAVIDERLPNQREALLEAARAEECAE